MTNETNPEVNNTRHRAGMGAELIWPIMFFCFGAAMLIWPNAFTASAYGCDPGAYGGDALDCLIGTAWGKPDAIGLCFIIAFLMLLSALRRRLKADDAF